MAIDCKCEVCGEKFVNVKLKANHIRWKHKSKEFYETTNRRIAEAVERDLVKKRGEIKPFQVSCVKCNKNFTVNEREKDFPLKLKYFCSRTCANAHVITNSHRKKARESQLKYLKRMCYIPKIRQEKACPFCGKTFYSNKNKFCSSKCVHKNRRKHLDEYRRFALECRFQFSLNQYPTEFDFDLIKKRGWYKAKNRGHNPNGVTRDHIVSVRWAYEHGIDSKYISHPANCQLMLQLANVSKGKKASLTIEELMDKIKSWNEKYPSPFTVS